MTASIKIIASEKNWIESRSVEQLKKTAELPGIVSAVGLPDLHPGKDAPIGAAFASEGIIYPHLVGNDIGCGMGLWKLDISRHKIKVDRSVKRLTRLEGPWDGDTASWLADFGVANTEFDLSLGTIGGGNHFAELQRVEEVYDARLFEEMTLDEDSLYLLVHSGSRGLGESILRQHTAVHKNNGVREDSPEAAEYLEAHSQALNWARANRSLISHRFLTCLGIQGKHILDISHNLVEKMDIGSNNLWLHRKGAAPSNTGPLVIPGSRGSSSYLVAPTGDQVENLATLAHGAGRKWGRADCRGRLENRFTRESLSKTALGSWVICDDRDLIYEEAPQAYKDIDIVIKDLVEARLIKIIARLNPLITYKTRADHS